MADQEQDPLPDEAPLTSYTQAIDYLYMRLPMFTRVGSSALKADLRNTLELCRRLDDPQDKFVCLHVGGTNGKGSTSHMLAAILQSAGYRTGLYTSPHLLDFRERIRINGGMIPEEEVLRFVNSQRGNIEEIDPSFFEVTVAMAFLYFARQEVDIAVIEVGLGGRLDSTNVIRPLLSVITNIGYDHVSILGNTLAQIAAEKAGVIKPGAPVVIGDKHPETAEVFTRKAAETGSPVSFASSEWEIKRAAQQPDNPELLRLEVKSTTGNDFTFTSVELDLTGTYQLRNLPAVLSTVIELRKKGYRISDEHIISALRQVKKLTGLMGRWQILKRRPLTICDTGHNEDGIREVLKNIALTPFEKLHIVIGMVRDKEISKILGLLPKDAAYYFCSPDLPRARPAEELRLEAKTFGLRGQSYQSVAEATKAAENQAGGDDLIFIGGSTFVVAEGLLAVSNEL